MATALEALERGEAYGFQSGVRSRGLTWHIDRRTTQRASAAVLTGTGMAMGPWAMAVKWKMEPQPDPSPRWCSKGAPKKAVFACGTCKIFGLSSLVKRITRPSR